jgi:hypothetical protein
MASLHTRPDRPNRESHDRAFSIATFAPRVSGVVLPVFHFPGTEYAPGGLQSGAVGSREHSPEKTAAVQEWGVVITTSAMAESRSASPRGAARIGGPGTAGEEYRRQWIRPLASHPKPRPLSGPLQRVLQIAWSPLPVRNPVGTGISPSAAADY